VTIAVPRSTARKDIDRAVANRQHHHGLALAPPGVRRDPAASFSRDVLGLADPLIEWQHGHFLYIAVDHHDRRRGTRQCGIDEHQDGRVKGCHLATPS
jgi:hypothetical protein